LALKPPTSPTGVLEATEPAVVKTLTAYGGIPDVSTTAAKNANVAAFNAFQAELEDEDGSSYYLSNRGRRLVIPYGQWFFNDNLDVARLMVIEGDGGIGARGGTQLIFDAGVPGIVIHRGTTSPDGAFGDWSTIRDLSVKGGGAADVAYGSGTAGIHGIQMHARAYLERVEVTQFTGNGVHIQANSGGSPATNANCWGLLNVRCTDNGLHGVYVDGVDANAGLALLVDCSGNGGWGIYDSSFLGNTWVQCHTASNGGRLDDVVATTLNGGINSSVTTITVTDATNLHESGIIKLDTEHIRYSAKSGNNLTGCTRGIFNGSGTRTTAASHSNGASVFQMCGGYKSEDPGNKIFGFGNYTENGQSAADDKGPLGVQFGGTPGDDAGDTPTFTVDSDGQVFLRGGKGLSKGLGPRNEGLGDGWARFGANAGLYWAWDAKRLTGATDAGIQFAHNGSSGWGLKYGNSSFALEVDTTGAQAGLPRMPFGFLLGANGGTERRIVRGATNAALTQPHIRGDIFLYDAPTAGGFIGEICVTAGSPGTFKTFGAITA
jgi:hypothetical protein